MSLQDVTHNTMQSDSAVFLYSTNHCCFMSACAQVTCMIIALQDCVTFLTCVKMQFFCEFIDLEFIQGKLDDALLTSKSSLSDLPFATDSFLSIPVLCHTVSEFTLKALCTTGHTESSSRKLQRLHVHCV